MTATPTLSDELLVHLVAADRQAASDRVVDLVGDGLPLRVVVSALADAMREVGDLWAAAVWTVADEHAATAVAEAALSAASMAVRPRRSARGRNVVVACVEGDWHGLPSRMTAELLVHDGWTVRYLGASQPTDLLAGYVVVHRPDVVVLTCSVPMALPEVGRAVALIQSLGLPVLVGGRAFGESARRAEILGAAGWGLDVLAVLGDAPPALPTGPDEYGPAGLDLLVEIAAVSDEWEAAAMSRLGELMPEVGRLPQATVARTRADLRHLIDMTATSLRLHEEDLLLEQCVWLQKVLLSRSVAPEALHHGLAALRGTVPRLRPVTSALVEGLLDDADVAVREASSIGR